MTWADGDGMSLKILALTSHSTGERRRDKATHPFIESPGSHLHTQNTQNIQIVTVMHNIREALLQQPECFPVNTSVTG